MKISSVTLALILYLSGSLSNLKAMLPEEEMCLKTDGGVPLVDTTIENFKKSFLEIPERGLSEKQSIFRARTIEKLKKIKEDDELILFLSYHNIQVDKVPQTDSGYLATVRSYNGFRQKFFDALKSREKIILERQPTVLAKNSSSKANQLKMQLEKIEKDNNIPIQDLRETKNDPNPLKKNQINFFSFNQEILDLKRGTESKDNEVKNLQNENLLQHSNSKKLMDDIQTLKNQVEMKDNSLQKLNGLFRRERNENKKITKELEELSIKKAYLEKSLKTEIDKVNKRDDVIKKHKDVIKDQTDQINDLTDKRERLELRLQHLEKTSLSSFTDPFQLIAEISDPLLLDQLAQLIESKRKIFIQNAPKQNSLNANLTTSSTPQNSDVEDDDTLSTSSTGSGNVADSSDNENKSPRSVATSRALTPLTITIPTPPTVGGTSIHIPQTAPNFVLQAVSPLNTSEKKDTMLVSTFVEKNLNVNAKDCVINVNVLETALNRLKKAGPTVKTVGAPPSNALYNNLQNFMKNMNTSIDKSHQSDSCSDSEWDSKNIPSTTPKQVYATNNIGKNERWLKYKTQAQNQSPSHEGRSIRDSQPAADVTPIDPNVFTNLFHILSQRRHVIEDSISSAASSCVKSSLFISVADLDKTVEEMNIPNVQKQAISQVFSSVIEGVITKSQILLSATQGGSSSQQYELNVSGIVINDHDSSDEENR